MTSKVEFTDLNAVQLSKSLDMPAPDLHTQVRAFACKAENLADQILHQNQPSAYTGPVIIHDRHYYHYPSSWFWYDPCPFYYPSPRVVVVNNNNCDDRKKDDNGGLILLAIVSSIVAGVAVYALGSSISAHQEASQDLQDTEEFKQTLAVQNHFQALPADIKDHLGEVVGAVQLEERICTRIKNSALGDIVLNTAMLGSAGSALAGAGLILGGAAAAATTAPALITGGVVAGLVTAGGKLFKWGFDNTEKANVRDAQLLKDRVADLKKI